MILHACVSPQDASVNADVEDSDTDAAGEDSDTDAHDDEMPDEPMPGVVDTIDCDLGSNGVSILGQAYTTEDPGFFGDPFRIEQLEVGQQTVYFADGAQIHGVARGGGSPELLVEDARPFNDGMVLHGDAFAWTANVEAGWEVFRAPIEGGARTSVTAFEGYTHQLRTDGTTLVWNGKVSGFPDEARLYAMTTDETQPRIVATGRYGWTFDVDDGVIYAEGYLPGTEPEAGAQVVFSLPTTGGEPTILADGFDDETPTGIVAGRDDVHYLRVWGTQGRGVERVPKAGGDRVELDLGEAPIPDHLVEAGGDLFGVTIGGEVWLLQEGQPPRQVATSENQLYPGHVAADDGTVFVAHWDHVCEEIERIPDEHHGGTIERCVRSVTRRCIEAIEIR